MINLVFLEAATQSEGAATIIESNEALINFATAEVDSLVEEQALYVASNVCEFVEESFDITYENMTDPISDIVVEATSIFADVIASNLSDKEKKELIEGYAHIIAMGDGELISEIMIPLNATGAAGIAGGGGVAGGAIGGVIGNGAAMLFSKKRKIWKDLVEQEKQLRASKANTSKINKIVDEKKKAKKAHDKAKFNGTANGMVIGSFVGAAGGMAAGLHYGRHL